jgi:hypothetical protein
MLLFRICRRAFAQKHGERHWNVGQCIRSQFKAFSRSSWSN